MMCTSDGHFFVRHLVGSDDVVVMVCRRCGVRFITGVKRDVLGNLRLFDDEKIQYLSMIKNIECDYPTPKNW